MSDMEFVPNIVGNKNCDAPVSGTPHPDYDYLIRSTTGDDDYPAEACPRYLQVNGKFDNLQVTAVVAAGGQVSSNGGAHVLSNKKNLPFDIPHPNKPGWRLRHVCIEGPEIAVYCRGKVPDDGVINLPSFWEGLVNPEDITINLTPIGFWQELFVQEVRWGRQVVVRNNAGGAINADYHIIARRLDDDLVVEYEGETHEDYPNGNEGYSFNFEHNYVKNLIQETVRQHLDTST